MQVSATLIAAQQAAREAQAKFHAAHIAPAPTAKAPPQASFSAALGKTESFSPLPFAQAASAPRAAVQSAPPQATAQQGARLGANLDITI